MPFTYNKGEWSEFYVFIKSLVDKKITVLDSSQEATDDFYKIIKVNRKENNVNYVYLLDNSGQISKLGDNTNLIISSKVLEDFLPSFLNQIKNNKASSFEIKHLNSILKELDTNTIKEGTSEDKTDITLVVDYKDTLNKTIGFSIKSNIGSKPTLLNASTATNFIYKIKGFQGKPEDINSIEGKRKIKDRIEKIRQMGGTFVYHDVNNPVFKNNLMKVDTKLPEIISSLLFAFFDGKGNKISSLTDQLNRMHLTNIILSKADLIYKIKKFLLASALGFFPSKAWDGYYSANGYIIVKESGEIGCFDVFDSKLLENYLFGSVKFETASSSKHDFGYVYEKDGEMYIKLNLQIRFV